MDTSPHKIVEIVKNYKSKVEENFELSKALIFGSYANGTYNDESDIDVALFINYKSLDEFFEIGPKLWNLARQVDLRIEPKLYKKDDLISIDEGSILDYIVNHSIEVN